MVFAEGPLEEAQRPLIEGLGFGAVPLVTGRDSNYPSSPRPLQRNLGPLGLVGPRVRDPGLRRLSRHRPGRSNLAPFGAALVKAELKAGWTSLIIVEVVEFIPGT
jgi:hypothetical protein